MRVSNSFPANFFRLQRHNVGFQFLVPANFKIPGPAHSNDGYEEMVYRLEGTLTWTVNDPDVQVGPGQALCIPRGAAHRWANNGNVPAKQLTVVGPGVMGPEYFREVMQLLSAGGPPNPAAIAATMSVMDESAGACTNTREHSYA